MHRLYYEQCYSGETLGYVIPIFENRDLFMISESQYKNALKKRTIGGDAGIKFRTQKRVNVHSNDLKTILFVM